MYEVLDAYKIWIEFAVTLLAFISVTEFFQA